MRNRATLILTTVKLHYWQLAGGILKLVILTGIIQSSTVIHGERNGLSVYTLASQNDKTIYSMIHPGNKLIIK
ncbi:hypothetical protein [Lactiplantibacillus plantarum]|uniref:hypothetical protein n=1 Tax=Lactiplantibacillus plantarum TaxID=1590 RepID=UPI003851852B|nr:LysM peptidoglycan-binding domain-containing protein [Lactiplantibacillus plantarum]